MRAAIARTGSSPLARGLRAWHHPSGHVVGIIPARAGFTPHSSISCMPAKDHPRSRGVYHLIPQLSDHRLGSSPLARGLPPHESRSLWTGRIIPARAGFTPGGSGSMTPTEDHPRSRGVYSHVVSCGVEAGGSSPLARGLPGARVVGPRAERIIPARAGFTHGPSGCRWKHGDHPRSRGVYTPQPVENPVDNGSSPLARGLPRKPTF